MKPRPMAVFFPAAALLLLLAAPCFSQNTDSNLTQTAEITEPSQDQAKTAAPFEPRWGLRLGAGYGWGLTGNNYGEPSTNASPIQFGYSVGESFAYEGEVLYDFLPHLGVGLGTFPLSLNTSSSTASASALSATAYSASVQFSTYPVLAEFYTRAPVADNLDIVTGFGGGTLFSEDYIQDATKTFTGPSDQFVQQSSHDRQFNFSAVYRGSLGAEYRINRNFSLFLDVAFMGVNLTTNNSLTQMTTTHASGEVDTSRVAINYVPNPPALIPNNVSRQTTVSGATTTVVTTADDGQTQSTLTVVKDTASGNVLSSNYVQTSTLQLGSGGENLIFNQLSTRLSLDFYF